MENLSKNRQPMQWLVFLHLAKRLAKTFRHPVCRVEHVFIVVVRNDVGFRSFLGLPEDNTTKKIQQVVSNFCEEMEKDFVRSEEQETLPPLERSVMTRFAEVANKSKSDFYRTVFESLREPYKKILIQNDLGPDCVEQQTAEELKEIPAINFDVKEQIEKARKKMIRRIGSMDFLRLLENSDVPGNGFFNAAAQEAMEIAVSRSTKRNFVLVGEPGVGKSFLLKNLITQASTKEAFSHLSFVEIEPAALFADTSLRGQLEGKIRKLIELATEYSEQIVFVMDELHILFANQEIAQLIKSPISDGKLVIVGATTPKEYREFLESDMPIARRFTKLIIGEPKLEEVEEILKSFFLSLNASPALVMPNYSEKSFEELAQYIIFLAERFLSHRNFPDKALDILDTALSIVKLNNLQNSNTRTTLGRSVIELAVHNLTKIPLLKIREESKPLVEEFISKAKSEIVGQRQPILNIGSSVEKHFLLNRQAPLVLLFSGPSGVGKTLTAKVLAETLFGSKQNLLKLDMSEYSESNSVAKLIGAPPGYQGAHLPSSLTEPIRQNPNRLILLDEFDKAHSSVHSLLLQIADDGFLSDSFGNRVDFRQSIFVLTANWKLSDNSDQAKNQLSAFVKEEVINRISSIIIFSNLKKLQLEDLIEKKLRAINCILEEKQSLQIELSRSAIEALISDSFSNRFGVRPLERKIEELCTEMINRVLDFDSSFKGRFKIFLDGDEEFDFLCLTPKHDPYI